MDFLHSKYSLGPLTIYEPKEQVDFEYVLGKFNVKSNFNSWFKREIFIFEGSIGQIFYNFQK